MQKIGIFVNKNKDLAKNLFVSITKWAEEQDMSVTDISDADECFDFSSFDLLISIGGDGSLIKLASLMKGALIPVLGINAGSLGFLTTVKEAEVFDELSHIIQGSYEIEDRSLLHVKVKEGKETHAWDILNDVVISREGLTRFLDVRVSVDGELLDDFGGDGVIIATPTGSSAYTLSAGGPLVYPTLDTVIITPLCPHSLRKTSYVLPTRLEVCVQVRCEHENEVASLICDGHEKIMVGQDAQISIVKSQSLFRIIKGRRRDYFAMLREKL